MSADGESPAGAFLGGFDTDVQLRGCLGNRHLFHMSQQQNFAVEVRHLGNHRTHSLSEIRVRYLRTRRNHGFRQFLKCMRQRLTRGTVFHPHRSLERSQSVLWQSPTAN